MKKPIIITVVLIVVAFVSWRVYDSVFVPQGGERGFGARPVPVEVSNVEQRTMRDRGEFSGTLLPLSKFSVAPKVSGRLEKLHVNIGDTVRNGDLIAVLDSEEYEQVVLQAKAALQVSQANLADSKSELDIATRELTHVRDLLERKIASETELDAALSNYNSANSSYEVSEAQVKQSEAALRAAEVRLSYTKIKATWEDNKDKPRIVAERFVDEGEMLSANANIVSIVDLSTVRAIINVVEQDFPEIRIGQPTSITTDAYGDRVFTGKVARRAPVLQEESRQARVEIEIPNPEGLLAPGMFVRVMIEFARHDNVKVVPQTALVRRNDIVGVFQADLGENKAHFVAVRKGIADSSWVEIIEPDLQGPVVVLGHNLLEDGSPTIVPEIGDEEADAEAQAPGGPGR